VQRLHLIRLHPVFSVRLRFLRRLIISTLAATLIAANASPARAGWLVSGNAGALDCIAFAVDGAESSHGANRNMWRAEPDGPQGPMQVSAAAAEDVGGGNRFDPSENRVLGRAYLAHLFRRYANWPDAIAAYNWGPGRMDAWIGAGRPSDKFPITVSLYRMRVLFGSAASNSTFGNQRLGIARRTPPRPLADRLHPSRESIEVERLYTTIMAQTERFAR
jgi:transglycosylase-like protein with SLT domain